MPHYQPYLQRIGYLLKRTQQALRARMDSELLKHHLTTPQYAALSAIEQVPRISNSKLAQACFVTPQTMIRILANLEEGCFIRRVQSQIHGRVIENQLTDFGKKTLILCHEVVLRVETQMLQGFSLEAIEDLQTMLITCADNVEKL